MINRQAVHNKHNGHCAYCGKEIDVKEMQVDHAVPKVNGGTDDFSNLMPSCRRCNHYKRGEDVKRFRQLLMGLLLRLQKIYIYKVALDYGFIEENGWDGKFYFEKVGD